MSIPKRITQIWLGDPMPAELEKLCDTVRQRNPDWIYVRLGDNELATLGVSADRLHDEFGTWAAATNFIRLLVLQKVGGVYLDTDFECLRSLDPLLDMGDCLAAEQDGGRICNAFMAATPNHPWVNWQLAHIGDYDRRDAASGVYLASAAPRELVKIISQTVVYPWLYSTLPAARGISDDTLAIHHWKGSWVVK